MEVEGILGVEEDIFQETLPLPSLIKGVRSIISPSNTATSMTNTTSEGSSNEAVTHSDSSPIALVPKPGTKSAIWGYFGLKPDTAGNPIDNGQVFCRLCN